MLDSPCPELTVIVINKFSQPYHVSTALGMKIIDIDRKLMATHSSQTEPQNNTVQYVSLTQFRGGGSHQFTPNIITSCREYSELK